MKNACAHRAALPRLAELFHERVFELAGPGPCFAPSGSASTFSAFGLERFDVLEHLLCVRIVDRREVADQHGDLASLIAAAKTPAGRRAVVVQAAARIVVAELEIHFVNVGGQSELVAQLLRPVRWACFSAPSPEKLAATISHGPLSCVSA